MKVKIWLMILAVMISTNFLNAQVEFPVLDARWCYYGYGDTGANLGNFCFSPSELVELNGNAYTKIEFKKHPYNSGHEELLYREEDRRFYVIPENHTEEILVYDFNLIVGDTFVTNYAWGLNDNDTLILFVQSVDTIITLDGVSRKRIFLENGSHQGRWVEGIGSLDWVFVYPAYSVSVSGGYIFICHSQGTETIITEGGSGTEDCNLIIKTDDLKQNSSFDIYPNPVEDFINVDFKNINAKSIVIISLTGNIILEKKINPEQNDLQIFTKLEAGIYFAKLYKNDGVVSTRKFIKI